MKLVAVDALPALSGHLVMGNLVTRDFERTLATAGDTVNVPIPPAMVANNIAEGGSVQAQSQNVGNAQIVLNTHAEATFQIPDVTKVIAVPDLLRLYMQPAMIALAEKVESDLLALYAQFTANTPLGTGGATLTEAAVDAAETALFREGCADAAEVPGGGQCLQPTAADLALEYQTSGDAGLQALIEGSIGRIKDFYVFRSQFVKKTGSAPVTTNNIAFAKSSLGLAIRRLPRPLEGTGAIAEYAELGNLGMRITMSYQPNTLAQQFTVDMLYGVGVLRNDHGVQVRS